MFTVDRPKIRGTIWKIGFVADALAVALLLASSAVRGTLVALCSERFAGPGAIPWRHRRLWGTLLAIQGLCWSLWCGFTAARSPDTSWGIYLPGLAVALTSALWLHGMRPPTYYAENAS